MFSLISFFIGILSAMLVVSVFNPPIRKIAELPSPAYKKVYSTPTGCVIIHSSEIGCTDESVSLNLLASKDK